MRKLIIALVLFIVAIYSNILQAQSGRPSTIKGEQIKQHKRIKHGVSNGELTRREAVKLKTQQAKIQHDLRVAKANGVVTPSERAHIKHEQNRASRNIYRQKHDVQ